MTPERFNKIKQILASRQPDLTVLMEDLHKPRNFAAVLRSCDAVGLLECHAVAPRGIPFNRPKAAAGSLKWLSVQRHQSQQAAYAHLRAKGFTLVAAHPSHRAIDFRDYDYTQPTALVLGSELNGLSDPAIEDADLLVTIPMLGMVQSLNVSVSAALILYEAQRQRQSAGLYQQSRLTEPDYHSLLFQWAYPKLARYCQRHQLAYPPIDEETGDIDYSKFDISKTI